MLIINWLQFSCFQFPGGEIRRHERRSCFVLEDGVSEMINVALVGDAFTTDVVNAVLLHLTDFALFLAQGHIVHRFVTRSYREHVGMQHPSENNKYSDYLSTASLWRTLFERIQAKIKNGRGIISKFETRPFHLSK